MASSNYENNPQCRSCAFCLPQSYEKKEQFIARCAHHAFPKEGLRITYDKVDTVPANEQIILKQKIERPALEDVERAHDLGYFYQDMIDIKGAVRYCDHWTHPATFAADALAANNDSIDNYPETPAPLFNWIKAGSPLVPRDYPALSPRQVHQLEQRPNPPVEVEEIRTLCATCTHFKRSLNPETNAVELFVGECHKRHTRGSSGLFDLANEGNEVPRTYSFLSCPAYQLARKFDKGEPPVHLPSRLQIFIETNPVDRLSYETLYQLSLFPTVNLQTLMTDERIKDLAETDLSKTVQARFATFNFQQFHSDYGHTVAADYFAKRMRGSTKHVKAFWDQYKPSLTEVDGFMASLPRVSQETQVIDPTQLLHHSALTGTTPTMVIHDDYIEDDEGASADLSDFIAGLNNGGSDE